MILKKHFFLLLAISTISLVSKGQNHDWANFIEGVSGTNTKSVIELCMDDDDNVYALGEYQLNVSNGADTLDINQLGSSALYLAKYDIDGNPIWFKRFGTKSYDFGNKLEYINGSLYVGAFFQGDSIFFNDTIIKRGADEVYLLKFDTDGKLLKHRTFNTIHGVSSITKIETTLYVANEEGSVRLMNENLETQGIFTFGGNNYRNVLNVTNVNDTSILVSGYFAGTISYDTLSIQDTLSGAGDAVFMALLSKTGDLQWMQAFGNISGQAYPLDVAYHPGDSRFYMTGVFKDAFLIQEELLAPATNNYHSFLAGFNLNGSLDFAEVFYPDNSGFAVMTNVLANDANVFVSGKNGNGSEIRYGIVDTLRYKRTRFFSVFKFEKDGTFVWGESMGGINNNTSMLKEKNLIVSTHHHPFYDPEYGCDTYQDNEGVIIHRIIDSLSSETPQVFFSTIKRRAEITTLSTMSNFDSFYWDFDDGSDLDTVTINPVHVYQRKGLINMSLNATNKCGTSTYTRKIRIRGIGGMYPNRSTNTNLYVGSIKGVDFKDGATFRLVNKSGVEKDICSVHYIDSATYNIMIEFDHSPSEIFDLFMETGTRIDTLLNALVIDNVHDSYNLDVYFSGSPKILVSRSYRYVLVVENKSDQAAYGVPITILANAAGRIQMSKGVYLNDITKKWSNKTGHFRGMLNDERQEVHQAGFFIIPVLPAGKKHIFKFALLLENPGTARVTARYNDPIFSVEDFFISCSNSGDTTDCPSNAILDRITDIFDLDYTGGAGYNLSNLGCVLWSNIVGTYGDLSSFNGGADYLGDIDIETQGTNGLQNRAINLGAMVAEEIQQANPDLSEDEVLREVDKLLDLIPNVNTAYDDCSTITCPDLEPIVDPEFSCENGDCPDLEPIPIDCGVIPCPELEPIVNNCDGLPCPDLVDLPEPSLWEIIDEAYWKLRVVAALDPNEKYPIQGSDENNYIAKGRDLLYHITFENADTATAPASEVFVYDTLDLSVMDTTNFEWLSFGFGDQVINLNEKGRFVMEDVDMRPYGGNVVVRFVGEIDSLGILKVSYTSLDPATYVLTDVVDDGFLPPNNSKPEGEGFFDFRIGQKPDLTHGTLIENFASIVFDRNAPIITPTAINHIDTIAPISSVVPFASETQSETILHVEFSSTDDGSGTAGYNVYRSVNNGGYHLIAKNYPKDYMDIKVYVDSTYSFFSQAVDHVGNWERKFITSEASIKIVKDITDIDEIINTVVRVYPVPVIDDVAIETNLNEPIQSIRIIDMSGKIYKMYTSINLSKYKIDMSDGEAGMYFIEIITNNKSYLEKIVKE